MRKYYLYVTLKFGYGTELYYKLQEDLEIGAGIRQMVYVENDLWAINGQLSKYFGNNYLAIRPYMYILADKNITYAGILDYRRYFDSEQWLGLTLNYGYYSNEPVQAETVYRQNSGGFYGTYHFRAADAHFLRLRTGLQKEQLSEQEGRLRYLISIGYWLTFK